MTHCILTNIDKHTGDVTLFDVENKHPNIRKVISQLHWTRAYNYLFKEGFTVPRGNLPRPSEASEIKVIIIVNQ